MNRKKWKSVIKQACIDANTYEVHFDSVIDSLAGILQVRDEAEAQYDMEGRQPTIDQANVAGGSKKVKNPLLTVIMDSNTQALAYWRDLGLTPAGLKKLNADAIKEKRDGGLEKLLTKVLDG